MPGIHLGFSNTLVNEMVPGLHVITPFFCAKCLWLKCVSLEENDKQVQKTTIEILMCLKYHHG